MSSAYRVVYLGGPYDGLVDSFEDPPPPEIQRVCCPTTSSLFGKQAESWVLVKHWYRQKLDVETGQPVVTENEELAYEHVRAVKEYEL